jgi:hypothetical protein
MPVVYIADYTAAKRSLSFPTQITPNYIASKQGLASASVLK